MIKEKCLWCNQEYDSPIDKRFDICPNCEKTESELYDTQDYTEMIQTFNDKTLMENK